jgi:hypothetical protein
MVVKRQQETFEPVTMRHIRLPRPARLLHLWTVPPHVAKARLKQHPRFFSSTSPTPLPGELVVASLSV